MNTKVNRLPFPDRFTDDANVAAAVLGKLHKEGAIWIWNYDGMSIPDALISIAGTKDLTFSFDDDFAFLTTLPLNSLAARINKLIERAEEDPEFLKKLEEEAEGELGMDLYTALMFP